MYRPSVRYIAAGLALLACLIGIRSTWRMGLARTLAQYAISVDASPRQQLISRAAADEAVRLSPADPEGHHARGIALLNAESQTEAIKEFELAATLRPRDYKIWLNLARAREDAGDDHGALEALRQAIKSAPSYAQPRWHIGNLLLRTGRTAEAFAEMRRAAESDPTFLLTLIDLAWGVFKGDAVAVQSAVQPQTTGSRVTLANILAKRGKPAEAIAVFRDAVNATSADHRQMVAELIAAKHFSEAYKLWSSGPDRSNAAASSGIAALTDGGFEGQINLDDRGFGWQLQREPSGFAVSRDTTEPRAGAYCLRMEWKGNSNPGIPVISQLVLTEANTRYQLRFAIRTKEIVSGGLPWIVVTDMSAAPQFLAASTPLPAGTNSWQEFTLEFESGNNTRAVLITLQRQTCGNGQCPVFGFLWLDALSLQKQSEQNNTS